MMLIDIPQWIEYNFGKNEVKKSENPANVDINDLLFTDLPITAPVASQPATQAAAAPSTSVSGQKYDLKFITFLITYTDKSGSHEKVFQFDTWESAYIKTAEILTSPDARIDKIGMSILWGDKNGNTKYAFRMTTDDTVVLISFKSHALSANFVKTFWDKNEDVVYKKSGITTNDLSFEDPAGVSAPVSAPSPTAANVPKVPLESIVLRIDYFDKLGARGQETKSFDTWRQAYTFTKTFFTGIKELANIDLTIIWAYNDGNSPMKIMYVYKLSTQDKYVLSLLKANGLQPDFVKNNWDKNESPKSKNSGLTIVDLSFSDPQAATSAQPAPSAAPAPATALSSAPKYEIEYWKITLEDSSRGLLEEEGVTWDGLNIAFRDNYDSKTFQKLTFEIVWENNQKVSATIYFDDTEFTGELKTYKTRFNEFIRQTFGLLTDDALDEKEYYFEDVPQSASTPTVSAPAPAPVIVPPVSQLPTESVQVSAPKKRGRPKKVVTEEAKPAAAPQPDQAPKKRGRPRKMPVPDTTSVSQPISPVSTADAPKKRGRPKKNINEIKTIDEIADLDLDSIEI